MKAILTRYIGQTERRPARIIASDMDGNRVIVSVNACGEELGRTATHRAAALALCAKMEWTGTLVPGEIKHGLVWVFTS